MGHRIVFSWGITLLTLAACSGEGSEDAGLVDALVTVPTEAPTTSTPPPAAAPPPESSQAPVGLVGGLPNGVVVADTELRKDIDIPRFHIRPRSEHYNDQPGLHEDFPRLTAWGECITKRRDHNRRNDARCIIREFKLVEIDGSGRERVVARFDLSEPRRGKPVDCGFEGDPPVRTASYCAGANYRREGENGDLCWYAWCVGDYHLPDEGIGPMENGSIRPDGRFVINVARRARRVSHWWTQKRVEASHPFPRMDEHAEYYLDIRFRTIGEAVLRIGADGWTPRFDGPKRDCQRFERPSNNCEMFFSNWYRSTRDDGPYHRLRFSLTYPLY